MWSTYKACKDIIQREWSQHGNWKYSNPVQLFKETTKLSMVELKGWSKVEFRGRKKKLDELVDRLKELRFSGEHYSNEEEVKRVKR